MVTFMPLDITEICVQNMLPNILDISDSFYFFIPVGHKELYFISF